MQNSFHKKDSNITYLRLSPYTDVDNQIDNSSMGPRIRSLTRRKALLDNTARTLMFYNVQKGYGKISLFAHWG
jgi:hypothetical protein